MASASKIRFSCWKNKGDIEKGGELREESTCLNIKKRYLCGAESQEGKGRPSEAKMVRPKEDVLDAARTDHPNSNQTTENSATIDEDAKKANLAARLTQIFITSCVFGVFLDPLFLYIPLLNQDLKCLRLDNTIKIIALVLRSFTDLFYVGRIILQVCRFEKYSPSIRQFLLKKCSSKLIKGLLDLFPEVSNEFPKPPIGKEIWESSIIVDILAILPLPQVAIVILFPKRRLSRSFGMRTINFLVMGQYLPRVLRIYLSCKKAKKPFKGQIPLWVKGLLNLFMYILASHVLGAFWYFFAAQQIISCWEYACEYGNGCGATTLDCHDHQTSRTITVLNNFCPVDPPNATLFDFGIYLNVLQSGALWSTDYPLKFLNSFCWGLRNLSSLASNLQPSFYTWEIAFVAFISILGLILFVYLIGNLQTYVLLDTQSLEEQRRKNKLHEKIEESDKKVEEWLSRYGIPLIKKQKIMEEIKRDLEENSDINVEREIPSFLSKEEIDSCSSLSRLRKVPLLKDMDKGVLEKISKKLKPEKYTHRQIIIEKDKPLEKMIFIVDGHVTIGKTDGSRSELGAGDFYGGQLLVAPLGTSFSDAKPIINESVQAIDDVRALVLYATDMENLDFSSKSVVAKFMNSFSNFASPSDVRLTWLKKVPLLKDMDKGVLREISEKLKPEKYIPGQIIIEKDKTLEKMFFIVDGHVRIVNATHSMRSLGAGDFYGGELLVSPLGTSSSDAKPIINESVEAIDDVQALVLYATDMESISSKSKSIYKKLCMVTILKKVPLLKDMDEGVLREISEKLKLEKYTRGDIIIEKDKTLEKMLFIIDGRVTIEKADDSRSELGAGNFYGEKIPLSVLWTSSRDAKLIINESVLAIDDVQALVLYATDMKSFGSKSKSHFMKLCMVTMLKKVPLLKDMDKGVLREISEKLKPEKYTRGQIIIEKDKTLEKMLFIVDGRVTIEKTDGSRPELDAGKFYGEELLVSPSWTSSGDAKPIINESVQALDDVQALVLYATDMENLGGSSKSVFSKFMKHFCNFASPPDIRLTWLKKVPLLKDMDEGVLREISKKLKLEKYTPEQIIIKKDQTLEMMLFIVDGRVTIEKTDGSLPELGAGDFYGGQLLVEPLWTSFSDGKPIINESVQAIDDVQALVLYATDMERISYKSKSIYKKLCIVTILKKVPLLKDMDEEVLREISKKLKHEKYTPGQIIIEKDKTFEKMLFILDGHVTIEKTDGFRSELGTGNFYGGNLLVALSWTSSGDAKPITDEFVEALDDVQALVLYATDLESISSKSKSIYKKLCMVTILKKIIESDKKVEEWLSRHGIPLIKKQKIMEEIKRDLEENSDVNVEREIPSILSKEEIDSCSSLSRLRKVPLLKDMDEGVLVEISEKLHPEKYTPGQIIIEKDKTLEKMLFIVDGRVTIVNATHSMQPLGAGDFYGWNLLIAPSWTSSGDAKPINDESVEALDDVEALVLYATDMERISYKSKSIYKKLCMVTILKKVEIFQQMDEQVLKAISKRLKPMSFNANKYILKEKKTLNMMFFVVRGVVEIKSESAMHVNVEKTCELGCFYGEELVHWVTTWVSHQTFPTKLPLSPDSALCPYHGGSVKILALKADDLKSVLSDFTLPTDSDQPTDRLTILKNVERLETMDEEVLKEICGYLELRTYEDAYIIQKHKPIEMMFFIMRGVVSVTNGSSKHYRNEGGRPNHSGDDLIEHWLQSKSTSVPAKLPTSPFSFWAIGEVEVLVLKAEDMAKVQPGDHIR